MLLEHWIECLMARRLNALENLVRSVQVKYRRLMVAMVAEVKLLETSLIATCYSKYTKCCLLRLECLNLQSASIAMAQCSVGLSTEVGRFLAGPFHHLLPWDSWGLSFGLRTLQKGIGIRVSVQKTCFGL